LNVSQHRLGLLPEIVAWFTDEARVAIAPIHAEPDADKARKCDFG
jgi:hypothetical protein